MPVASTTYNLNFTAASLRPELARIIAEYYLAVGNWAEAKDRVLASNALQCRSAASSIRLERALRQRLQTLNHEQINLLAQGTAEDRAAIAWLAACKHIPFVFEFATEILTEKLVLYDRSCAIPTTRPMSKARCCFTQKLVRLTATSKNKVRQVLLRMLVEAGILETGNALGTIQRPVVSPAVVRVVASDNPHWLAAFLIPEHQYAGSLVR